MKSKFEICQNEIEKRFMGPYPLDRVILDDIVPSKPGVYIWFQLLNGRNVGYVGRSKKLLLRLRNWALDVNNASFYFNTVNIKRLNKTEKLWIDKAGDLNKL